MVSHFAQGGACLRRQVCVALRLFPARETNHRVLRGEGRMPSDNRERSFDDALAVHLRGGAKGIPHAECSDAETLAAYHEGSLPAEQVASLKTHLTSCERCQQILTALEATDQIAAPAVNITLQPAAAGKPAVPRLPPRQTPPRAGVAPPAALPATSSVLHPLPAT